MRNYIYDLIIFFSKGFNKLLSYSNPLAASLRRENIFLNPIRNWNLNSNISDLAKCYLPYKFDNSEVGDYTYVAENSRISHTKIGKFCSIGINVCSGYGIHPINGLSTSPMFYSTFEQNGTTLSSTNKITERKPITIGNDVFIGMNVTILDGVTIGDGAVIGAGAVVSKDIPPYAIAVGSPIKIIKMRFTEDQIDALLKIKWWNFEEAKLVDVESMFFDVDDFIAKYS